MKIENKKLKIKDIDEILSEMWDRLSIESKIDFRAFQQKIVRKVRKK